MRQAGATTTALVALVGWALFAFAGAYRWTLVPVVSMAAALLVISRPRVMDGSTRALDGALVASLAAIGIQLVPLPAALRHLMSPAAGTVEGTLRIGAAPPAAAALTLDAAATSWALATALALVAVFWIARTTFEQRGLREVSRGIAWMGLALAAIVFVQRFASPHHIYGFWAPITQSPDPRPLGPFLNRNDLATWLVLAIPLVIGYAAARTVPRLRGPRPWSGLAHIVDGRMVALLFSVLLMTAALVASLSRSGLAGLATALATLALLGRRRLGGSGASAFGASLVVVMLLALPFTNVAALGNRWGDVLPADVGGRVAIWRDSWAMAADFFGTGVGVGAFERGMLVYQRGSRLMFFNHAHNEYLQVLAEGGLLLGVPAGIAVLAGLVQGMRALRGASGTGFWFRAGALSGILGVAVQSVWDTGLRMPANGVLFAVAAAMALHRSGRPAPTSFSSGGRRLGHHQTDSARLA